MSCSRIHQSFRRSTQPLLVLVGTRNFFLRTSMLACVCIHMYMLMCVCIYVLTQMYLHALSGCSLSGVRAQVCRVWEHTYDNMQQNTSTFWHPEHTCVVVFSAAAWPFSLVYHTHTHTHPHLHSHSHSIHTCAVILPAAASPHLCVCHTHTRTHAHTHTHTHSEHTCAVILSAASSLMCMSLFRTHTHTYAHIYIHTCAVIFWAAASPSSFVAHTCVSAHRYTSIQTWI